MKVHYLENLCLGQDQSSPHHSVFPLFQMMHLILMLFSLRRILLWCRNEGSAI